jgi:Haem-binding domain
MKQYIRPGLYILLGLFILSQFYRPTRNLSGDTSQSIAKVFPVPDSVQNILKVACNDCHSNKTVYPWYNNVQPVASWLAHHIDEAKHHLNFDNFAKIPPRWQNHQMEEVIEQIEHNEMPMSSYTLMHKEAALSEKQKTLLLRWAKGVMDSLKAQNHPDSLIVKRRH